jgi:hypothetical protein
MPKEITCKSPGTLEFIDNKWWCIGEKIQSKSKYSRLNKTKKTQQTKKKQPKASAKTPKKK